MQGKFQGNSRMSSFVLISALAIPISTSSKSRSYGDMDDNKSEQRLVNLLRASKTPTREVLLTDAVRVYFNALAKQEYNCASSPRVKAAP